MASPNEVAGLPVGRVAELTGVGIETLRSWEWRHGAVTPKRTKGGARRYTEQEVTRVGLLKRLVDQGWSISSVAGRDTTELQELLGDRLLGDLPGAVLDAVLAFDLDEAEALLLRGARQFSPEHFSDAVLAPMLLQAGVRWADGRFRVAHEHVLSSLVRRSVQRLTPVTAGRSGEWLVGTTLPGERHALGVLMASMVAATHGRRVLMLEPELPEDELLAVVEGVRPRVLGLSFVTMRPAEAEERVAALAPRLPKGSTLVVGGRGVHDLAVDGVVVARSLQDFARWLSGRPSR